MAYKNTIKDYSQMIGYLTRDKTTDVPGSMVHEARNMKLAQVLRSEMDNFNTPDLEQSPDSFLRPGETLEDFDVEFRRPNAQGGRIPFAKAKLVQKKSEASYKAYEDKFGKELLDKAAQDKYGKNFRELDKTNELKFFKNQVNKYEDFIKENKRYPTTSEAYNIGLTQGGKKSSIMTDEVKTKIKNIYSSGEGGSTYISKKLSEEGVNIDDSTIRRFITAEEEAGNIVRPTKFKTQEAKAPKDRYNIIREVTDRDLKGFKVGSNQTEVLAPKGSKYKITFNIPGSPETTKIPSEYQGTQYFKTKAQADKAVAGSKKFSKDLVKQGKANRGLREIILEQVSDPNIEANIGRMKAGEDLATAHRASYKQIGKLGKLYNILNLGVEDPDINSGAIRKFENKLDNLYKEQNNLIKTARRSTNKGIEIPKNIQKRIDGVNKEISTVVDLTNQRVQGILIDAKTLKPYTYGVNYIKTYGMGFLDNKPVKEITDTDLGTIELNLKNQIAREKELGQETASFLRDRQPLLKYTKELSEPGFINKIPAKLKPIALATGMTIGGISAANAAEGLNTAEKIGSGAAVGGAYAARKPIMSALGKAFRTLGTRAAAVPLAGYTVYDNLKKGENVVDATLDPLVGLELMLPNMFKENVSKITSNPTIQKLLKVGKFGRSFTPIGAGITAAGLGIDAYKYGKERKQLLDSLTEEQKTELFRQEQSDVVKQQLRGDQNAFDEFSAARGGMASLNVKK